MSEDPMPADDLDLTDGFDDTDLGDGPDDAELARWESDLGRLARQLTAEDRELVDPPADLWDAIELAISHPDQAPDGRDDLPPPPRPSEVAPPQPRTGASPGRAGHPIDPTSPSPMPGDGAAGDGGPARVVVGRSRPALARRVLTPAAAVLAVAVAAVAVARSGDGGVEVASAPLGNDGLPVQLAGQGSATVLDEDGDLVLRLDLPPLPATAGQDAFYQVWMIDREVVGMVAVGVVDHSGLIDLPDDLDLDRFPIVDISVEPLDGVPAHSGQSILRGELHDAPPT